VRPLPMLSWNDKKRCRVALTGLVAAAVAAATLSGSLVVAAAPSSSGPAVRVIVRALPGSEGVLDRDITEAGGHVAGYIPLVTSAAASVPASALPWLAGQPGIAAVTPDGPVQLDSSSYSPTTDPGSLYSVEQALGVDQAWQDGYTGAGVGIALIDTGVTPVPAGLDGSHQVANGPDLSFDSEAGGPLQYLDANGHGTFMAGIIAGRAPAATAGDYPDDASDFLGIAPDAHIVSVKVGGANGAVDVSQVLAAIDWVVQHRGDEGLNIRVLNLSFGTDSTQSYLIDPLAYAAEVAWHQGIVVVASAGNTGTAAPRLADPAIDPYVIAVGASEPGSNGGFKVAPFSSRGDGTRNPDVVAPGTSIVSLADPGSVIADQFGSTGAVGASFFRGTGTSQATAVVSGIAALLIQEHPSASPDQIKALLTSTAVPIRGAPRASGHGEVMASDAIAAALPCASQSFDLSTGTGSLEASRGSLHVTLRGAVLTGEEDIFGNPVDTTSLATAEADADTWWGGTWNGATWSGDHWVWSPSELSWAGAAWTDSSWAGVAWSAVAAPSGTRNGVSWSGVSWSGVSWSGVSWSGVSWSGVSWSGVSWSGVSWSGVSWSSAGWTTVSWS